MNDLSRRAELIGILYVEDIDWHLRVYLLRGDLSEEVPRDSLFANLREKVCAVAVRYLSDEFKYLRSGFILAHYGRRGVTYSVWHWADWEGTWEYFCQAWYCYGRTTDAMDPLDRTEPILCQHELDVVMWEGTTFCAIARQYTSHEQIIREYRNCSPA